MSWLQNTLTALGRWLLRLRRVLGVWLSVLLGGWMVFDGMHWLITGRYVGPTAHGPWGDIVQVIGIDPDTMAVPFVVLGSVWLMSAWGLFTHRLWAQRATFWLSLGTLWYAMVGTVLCMVLAVMYAWQQHEFDPE